MDYDLKFQLTATDIAKIQRVTVGRYFRPLVLFSCGLTFLMALFNILQGENYILNAFVLITTSLALLYVWFPIGPHSTTRSRDANVKLDGRNLTSSLGTNSYEIPWPYFLKHGSLLEETDHFYFKSKLGKVYLPKRAFKGDDDMDNFRVDLSNALGDRCFTSPRNCSPAA